MKKIVLLPLVAAASLGLAACGGSNTDTATANDTTTLNVDEGLDANFSATESAEGTDLNAVAEPLNETDANLSADTTGANAVEGNATEGAGNTL